MNINSLIGMFLPTYYASDLPTDFSSRSESIQSIFSELFATNETEPEEISIDKLLLSLIGGFGLPEFLPTETEDKTDTTDTKKESTDAVDFPSFEEWLAARKAAAEKKSKDTSDDVNNYEEKGYNPDIFDPNPLSEKWGSIVIPTGYAAVKSGLFGNIHGTNAILSRYVGDNMPSPIEDPTAPGNTWIFTLMDNPWVY